MIHIYNIEDKMSIWRGYGNNECLLFIGCNGRLGSAVYRKLVNPQMVLSFIYRNGLV